MTNYFILPHPSLQPFVDNYILCTSENEIISFNGHWPASNETSLVFYLADQPASHINANKDAVIEKKNNCIIGLLTHYNGVVNFEGCYHTFMIQFRANGFNKVINIPITEFVNKIHAVNDVFGSRTKVLDEQLMNAKDIESMAVFADTFLLSFLRQGKKSGVLIDGITAVAWELFNVTQPLRIKQCAYKANMSVRNFERRFTEQVGVSPKLYSKLARFNAAVMIKTMQPQKSWTSVAYECSYFDQMHFIKDFKQFANLSPTEFINQNAQLNNNRAQEKFVFTKRKLI